MQVVLLSMLLVGVVSIVIGLLLGLAGEKLKVEEDPRVGQVRACFPGTNCGGCGYPGCDGLAAAIVAGEAPVNSCTPGGPAVSARVSEILGVENVETVRMVAKVMCGGDCTKTKDRYDYTGPQDCTAMGAVPGGSTKGCDYGCLGYGSCVKACGENGIRIVDGIAVIDAEQCVACGKCVAACPRHVIKMVPYAAKVHVACTSKDKGKDVMKVCDTGCIGCKKCERTCKFDAIHVIDNIAVIDYDKCKNCGLCAKECPKGIITLNS